MPLAPILLYPAFRCGSATPWGGSLLKSKYNKNAPCLPFGESLELSTLPGLNAADSAGTPLSKLISRYSAALTGTDVTEEFPLLIKLLDAKQTLSVQVHPDDAYARTHENKQGKNEAWIILSAAPDAQIVYGLRPGATRDMLRDALEAEQPIENLLRYVPVRAGDVFFIPAGMVHAVGAGILLYEIQQTSDITYRLYDWNRADANGRNRPLHIRQALDVLQPDLQLSAVVPQPIQDLLCRRELLLDTPYFRVEQLSDCRDLPIAGDPKAFSVLTALQDSMLKDDGRGLPLPAGQTVLIPAVCQTFMLSGGPFLLAHPRV